MYEDRTNEILDKPYFEKYIIHGTDGIANGVLFEFKKKFDQNQTLQKAFGEALAYLGKFNNNGLIQIPRWICIATFIDKKYWLIDASNYEEHIYKYNSEINPSSAEPVILKNGETQFKWLNPKDLVQKVTPIEKSNRYLLTKLNMNNFHNINDKFYDEFFKKNSEKNEFSEEKQNPSEFIKDLFKGTINIEKCINESGLDIKTDIHKINKLKKSLINLNKEEKILYWVEPIFINDLKWIIAEKWDHVGGRDYRKDRGAFFTPSEYAQKMQEYLKKIIEENKDKEILIIDRCAGTGQLEKGLDKQTLNKVILNTYEFCEWVNLGEHFQDKVKIIKPPYTNAQLIDIYIDEDVMKNGNALSKEFDIWLREYINDWRIKNPNGKIIFYENPPFRDETANSHGKGHSITENYVYNELKKTKKSNGVIRDLSFQFIWSASKFMKNYDEYCLISPIKYWKWNDIEGFEFVEGFLSNRKKYNASEGGLPIIRWRKNENSHELEICLSNEINEDKIIIKQIKNRVANFDINSEKNQNEYYAIMSIGNMFVHTGNILTNKNKGLTNKKIYVSNENILKVSVLNALNAWKGNNYLKDSLTIMKSADMQDKAWKDEKFLNDCLLWTLLTDKNECFSFHEEEKTILNEICYTGKAKSKLNINLFYSEYHKELITAWEQVYKQFTSDCGSEIFPNWKYGLKQIMEFNGKIYKKTRYGKDIEEYKYPELNSFIKTLKYKLNYFYEKFIEPKLEEYELLK